ncbi:ParA family protein [Catalinimonas sp. 4WD22]|uniref:ParA family protein n=1 Tax=Catalinimonas locisalis TaxID=3133978 RepID=UPI003100C28C
MSVTSIVNHKGGVGKTTTTLNLGKALSLKGFSVLIVDFDPQANLSDSIGVVDPKRTIKDTLLEEGSSLPIHKIADNFYLAPSELQLATAESKLKGQELAGYLALKEALDPVRKDYDYILIDCPPSLGVLTSNAFMASDEVMIVLSSQFLPTRGLATTIDAIKYAKRFNNNIQVSGILITQFEQTVIQKSIIEELKAKYGNLVYESMIRKNVAVQEASAMRTDVFSYDSKSAAANDYGNLCEEIIAKQKIHG